MSMANKVEVCGLAFTAQNLVSCVDWCCDCMQQRTSAIIHTLNAQALVMAQKQALHDLFASADLIVPDGDGVLLAGYLEHRQKGLLQKIAGIDLLCAILARCAQEGYRVYLLGGKAGVAQAAANRLQSAMPHLCICGTHHGYFENDDAMAEEIASVRPDFVAVCMGMPRQEQFMRRYRETIGCVMGGFGGSLDVLSGQAARAPRWVQKVHGEWLYRVLRQPSRVGRLKGYPSLYASVFWKNRSAAGRKTARRARGTETWNQST